MVDRTARPIVPVVHTDDVEHRRLLAVKANAALSKDGTDGMTAPLSMASYTTAELPDATLWEGATVYVSDTQSFAYSDGTSWQSLSFGTAYIVSPQDYGAVGDGVANDTTAVQAAFDAGGSTGAIVLLLPGTYLVTADTLSIAAPVTVMGGRNAIIKNASATGVTLEVASDYVVLDGFTIDGGNPNATVAGGYLAGHMGLEIIGDVGTYLTGCLVTGLQVTDCGNNGISVFYLENSIIRDCYITRCGYAGIGTQSITQLVIENNIVSHIYPGSVPGTVGSNCYGIYVSNNSSEPVSTDVLVHGNSVSSVTWEGLDEHDAARVTFSDNNVVECGVGIASEHHTSGNPGEAIKVCDNTIFGLSSVTIEGVAYRCTGGIICNGGVNTDQGTGLIVVNNYIESAGDRRASPGDSGAIRVTNWARFQVNDNICYNSYRNGIIFATDGTDACFYGTVSNNTVTDTNAVGGVQRDIRFQGRTGLLLCSDNFTTGGGDGCTQSGAPTYAVTFSDNLDV